MKLTTQEAAEFSKMPTALVGQRLCGRCLNLPNGWPGGGVVVGAFRARGVLRVLLAHPSENAAEQLFNERIESLVEEAGLEKTT